MPASVNQTHTKMYIPLSFPLHVSINATNTVIKHEQILTTKSLYHCATHPTSQDQILIQKTSFHFEPQDLMDLDSRIDKSLPHFLRIYLNPLQHKDKTSVESHLFFLIRSQHRLNPKIFQQKNSTLYFH